MKGFLDFITALLALIILSPFLLIIALAVAIDSKGGVVFKQKRIGKNGKEYYMYKFRTMVPNAQNMGTGVYSFKNDPRITRVGRFLRKTSLDELLQLWNIIKGDMSLIGPRSPVVGHFPEYETLSDEYKRRFSVLPGITGLAQVTGRNELLWDEKVKYDNIYIDKVKKYGIFYDIKILFLTVIRVLSMKDVSETEESMAKNEMMKNAQVKTSTETESQPTQPDTESKQDANSVQEDVGTAQPTVENKEDTKSVQTGNEPTDKEQKDEN